MMRRMSCLDGRGRTRRCDMWRVLGELRRGSGDVSSEVCWEVTGHCTSKGELMTVVAKERSYSQILKKFSIKVIVSPITAHHHPDSRCHHSNRTSTILARLSLRPQCSPFGSTYRITFVDSREQLETRNHSVYSKQTKLRHARECWIAKEVVGVCTSKMGGTASVPPFACRCAGR